MLWQVTSLESDLTSLVAGPIHNKPVFIHRNDEMFMCNKDDYVQTVYYVSFTMNTGITEIVICNIMQWLGDIKLCQSSLAKQKKKINFKTIIGHVCTML